ncbi:MAG TPA: aminotransferase class V-fold PLP-dependent enzyme [Acidimicrobiales bacterium]|nr:aminotransferase class V-fold PLP-dependent enzyme [Acidimicrobiales bacterium]
MIDIERLRADTPGCDNVIHFNHAGASLPPAPVTEALIDHLGLEADIGGYEAADLRATELEAVYDSLATLVGGHRDEIALVESATRAWDMAFYSFDLQPGDHVVTGWAEYGSNALGLLQQARRRGAVIDVVPDDADGTIDLDALAAVLTDRTRLISLTHCPSHNGLINPAAEVGRLAKEWGITFLLDACQSVGQLPVDVNELGADLLTATGRKFLRGPRGTGFLWVRRSLLPQLDPPFVDVRSANWTAPARYELRDDARRFETWESFVAGRLGLGAAAEYAIAIGLEAVGAQVGRQADALRGALADLEGVHLTDRGRWRSGIVTFRLAGRSAYEVRDRLREVDINVSVTTASVARLDPVWDDAEELVRASVHYLTTDEEIDQLVAAIRRLS